MRHLKTTRNTRKQQPCHKLMVGKWNITLLAVKQHKLVEETKPCCMDIVGIP